MRMARISAIAAAMSSTRASICGLMSAEAEHAHAAEERPCAVQPVTMTRPRCVVFSMSARVAASSSACDAPGQVRWKANSDRSGSASMTIPGRAPTRRRASSVSARFSAIASRKAAAPNSFTDSQTRSPGNPRESSGPCWLGS